MRPSVATRWRLSANMPFGWVTGIKGQIEKSCLAALMSSALQRRVSLVFDWKPQTRLMMSRSASGQHQRPALLWVKPEEKRETGWRVETGDGARLHSTTLNRSAERMLRPGLVETRQLVTDQRPRGPITSLFVQSLNVQENLF